MKMNRESKPLVRQYNDLKKAIEKYGDDKTGSRMKKLEAIRSQILES